MPVEVNSRAKPKRSKRPQMLISHTISGGYGADSHVSQNDAFHDLRDITAQGFKSRYGKYKDNALIMQPGKFHWWVSAKASELPETRGDTYGLEFLARGRLSHDPQMYMPYRRLSGASPKQIKAVHIRITQLANDPEYQKRVQLYRRTFPGFKLVFYHWEDKSGQYVLHNA